MSDVNAVNSDVLQNWSIDAKQPKQEKNNELGRDEFLELMVAQLNNQNPLEPQTNAEFIAQLAQFSTVEGIQNMGRGFEDLAQSYRSSQALQASSLVGGSVIIQDNTTSVLRHGQLVYGAAQIPPGAAQLTLKITDASGQVVEEVPLGYQNNGSLNFNWDGFNLLVNGEPMTIDLEKFATDEQGNYIPHAQGEYQFALTADVLGEFQQLDVQTSVRVDSVTLLENNQIQLNLANGQVSSLDQVTQISHVY